MTCMPKRLLPALLLAIACDGEAGSQFHFRDAGRPAITEAAADRTALTLEFVRTWGTSVGPESFGSIGAVGVSDAGMLAAYDPRSCAITMFDLQAGNMQRRFGRCGEGPGDLPRVTHLAFAGDTLLLLDEGAKRLHYLLPTGEGVRRASVSHLSEYGGIQALLPVRGDTVIASRSFSSGTTLGDVPMQDRHLLVKGTVESRRILASGIRSPAVMDNHGGNFHVGYAACLQPSGPTRRLVLMNRWAFEMVVVDASRLDPLAHSVTPLSWGAPKADRLAQGALMPTVAAAGSACGPDWVLISQVRLEGEGRDTEATGGHIEIRGYDGRLRASVSFDRSDSLLFGTPVAGFRDRVFYRANRLAAFPQIVEFRLAPRSRASGGEG